VELGADGVELDVQLSADGELVVCHDETVDRTSDGHGWIRDLTLPQLRELDFSNGREGFGRTPIPTLREVLELLRPTALTVNVELKNSVLPYPGMEQRVVDLVRETGMNGRVIYSTFNHNSAWTLTQTQSADPVGVLHVEPLYRPWRYASALGAAAVHPAGVALRLDPCVADCHAAGIAVHAWTMDEPAQISACARLGVDAVITNVPDVARGVLGV
jgi:glycerophosphoryl diester phosphodiesterase